MTNKLLNTNSVTQKKVSRYGFAYSKSNAKVKNFGSSGKSKKKITLANVKALGK